MKAGVKWIPRPSVLIVFYLVGFATCLLSQTIVSRQHGPAVYSNLLFAPIFVFREWLNQLSIAPIGSHVIAQILPSVIVAIFFPATLALLRSQKRAIRLFSVILLGILAVMTFWWGRLPGVL